MRTIEHEPHPPKPTVTSIVVFDPWPFHEKNLNLKNSSFYDGYGLHEFGNAWALGRADNTLISLSDGTTIVCQESYTQNALKALT